MLEISERDVEKISEYLYDNKVVSVVRIALLSGGCSGPALSLVLDEKKGADQVFNYNNAVFVVEKSFFDIYGRINMDSIEKTSGCG